MKLFSPKSQSESLVMLLSSNHCRIQHFILADSGLMQLATAEFSYTDLSDLHHQFEQQANMLATKGTHCHWVLNKELYQTHPTDRPNVAEKEIDEAIKWQIKDIIDQSVDEVLITHYQPAQQEGGAQQLVAVVADKALIESIIETTKQSGFQLQTIDIDELTLGHALKTQIDADKIIGFIGEDQIGLVFNFYQDGQLAFSRHKKGKFLPFQPANSLTLESEQEAAQESFLLEAQRTLDYVVSQIFRRPVDRLILQIPSDGDQSLVKLIQQLTEIPVDVATNPAGQAVSDLPKPTFAEVGAAMRVVSV